MKIAEELSDNTTLQELGGRIARYRLNRNTSQAALAKEAGISLRTLVRAEQGESVQITSLLRVLRALGLLANLDLLIPDQQASPVQQVKMKGKVRRRASGARSAEKPAVAEDKPWVWGDEE